LELQILIVKVKYAVITRFGGQGIELGRREGRKDSLLVCLFDGVGGVGHGGHAQLEVEGAPLSHLVHAAILLHQLVELKEVEVFLAECRLAGEWGACRGR